MTEFLAVLFYALALTPSIAIALKPDPQDGEETKEKET